MEEDTGANEAVVNNQGDAGTTKKSTTNNEDVPPSNKDVGGAGTKR